MKLTTGFACSRCSFKCGGTKSLTPNFGGNDCDRRCPIFTGTSNFLAGDLSTFLSSSGAQDVTEMNPLVTPKCCNGMRIRVVSWISARGISAEPTGTAVFDSFSRTSNAVKRILVPLLRPSPLRNWKVQLNCGFDEFLKKITEGQKIRPWSRQK